MKEKEDTETSQNGIGQLKNKGQLKRSVDSMKSMIALLISL